MTVKKSCPCCSGKTLTQCCGRYLSPATLPAPTAEALMRSRYSAYVLRESAYLLATWHPKYRPKTLNLDPNMQWFNLKIKQCEMGLETDTEGLVFFVAKYKNNGKAERLEENSRFNKVDGRWFYMYKK
jgi:SEC-C motif-containing protein